MSMVQVSSLPLAWDVKHVAPSYSVTVGNDKQDDGIFCGTFSYVGVLNHTAKVYFDRATSAQAMSWQGV